MTMTDTLVRTAIDLDRFRNTPLETTPFPHIVVPGFVPADAKPLPA